MTQSDISPAVENKELHEQAHDVPAPISAQVPRIQVGVDMGGTKIEVAAIDIASGNFLSRVRAPTPGNYDAAIRTICELVAKVETEAGSQGTVGVGTPGSISPRTGLMHNANTVWLNGRAFQQDLSISLDREVRLSNDANCLALSEVVDGAGVGSRIAFAVILGTGCGGGVVVDGRLVTGANGNSGEWGHTPLPWPGADELPAPTCWCGRKGCLEVWISGSGFHRDFAHVNGFSLSTEEIVAKARTGDNAAKRALDRYIDRLGRAMAVICDIVDPDTFILGGGMSNVTELYAQLPAVIRRHVFSDGWEGRIVAGKWGDSSGVRGAARLWSA